MFLQTLVSTYILGPILIIFIFQVQGFWSNEMRLWIAFCRTFERLPTVSHYFYLDLLSFILWLGSYLAPGNLMYPSQKVDIIISSIILPFLQWVGMMRNPPLLLPLSPLGAPEM